MKKFLIIVVAVLLPIVFILMGSVYIFTDNPLNNYKFSDCSIGVFNYDHSEILCTLPESQIDEFVDTLEKIDIIAYRPFDDTLWCGMHYAYEIRLSNGETIKISTIGKYIIVNGKVYECEINSLIPLDRFAENVFKEYYPITE